VTGQDEGAHYAGDGCQPPHPDPEQAIPDAATHSMGADELIGEQREWRRPAEPDTCSACAVQECTCGSTAQFDAVMEVLSAAPPEREAPTPASVRAAALHRIEQREATPGNPADGPYPASVGEVADELAGLVVELDAGPARGLVRELAARLPEREAPSREDVAVTLEQALLGSYDDPGDLIHPDSQIPAGEIQRLIHEAAVPMLAILFPVREDEQRADSCFEADVLADDEGGQE
jgi:hypothetical protein